MRCTSLSSARGIRPMKTFLLSYPRSGNSWTRYIAEHISGRPTAGCTGNPEDVPLCENTLLDNPLAHVRTDAEPILYKSHGQGLEEGGGNRLILLTRNPSAVRAAHEARSAELPREPGAVRGLARRHAAARLRGPDLRPAAVDLPAG